MKRDHMSDNISSDHGRETGFRAGSSKVEGTVSTPLAQQTGTESDGDDSVSSIVVEAVAKAEGTRPVNLTEPLYEAVDPDALDRLFGTGGDTAGGRIEFTYVDYRVTVTVDDDVYVSVYPDREP